MVALCLSKIFSIPKKQNSKTSYQPKFWHKSISTNSFPKIFWCVLLPTNQPTIQQQQKSNQNFRRQSSLIRRIYFQLGVSERANIRFLLFSFFVREYLVHCEFASFFRLQSLAIQWILGEHTPRCVCVCMRVWQTAFFKVTVATATDVAVTWRWPEGHLYSIEDLKVLYTP